ncbi:uncharacterized protein TRIADDRAFT_25476, partial [Trichoplax adhaerens]
LFNWNTKQLFIYLTAEYKTDRNPLNQIVLWDRIMLKGHDPRLIVTDVPEYVFTDDGHGLKGHKNVTLRLSWNIIPIAGLLPRIDSGHYSFAMPNEYLKRRSY